MLSASLLADIAETTGQHLQGHRLSTVSGGDINAAYRLQAEGLDWFVKLNRADRLAMFVAEAAGLQEMAGTGAVSVPKVIAAGADAQHAYLILDFIPLKALRGGSEALLGEQLAILHAQRQAYFGWHIDNTIGSTPQTNQRHHDWLSFWREQRLNRQLAIAAANGYTGKLQSLGQRLSERLAVFFTDYQPQPALLHGDLWAGNAACDSQGRPWLFDPACYYGDREADLAMTELFGGFGRDFYAAYQAEYPLDAGYATRKTLYNLYHILNHLNLFGSGYQGQALTMIERLLAETR